MAMQSYLKIHIHVADCDNKFAYLTFEEFPLMHVNLVQGKAAGKNTQTLAMII